MSVPPRVFISATSADLGSVRQLVKEALLSMDCHPVEQTNFPPDYRTVQEMLKDKIASCQAVLHIVGLRYGAEPNPAQLPDGTPRRSYTQMEYDLARQLNKKLYVFICPDDFPFDTCESEPEEKQQLQQAHRDAISTTQQHRTKVTSREELAAKVRELQIELQQLRRHIRRTSRNMLIGVAVLIVVLSAIGYAVARLTGLIGGVPEQVADVKQGVENVERTVQQESQRTIDEIRKLYEDPDVLLGKLKSYIREQTDQQIAKIRTDEPNNWRRIDEIEKQREQQLKSVEQMVTTIRKGLAGDPDPIFAEAARILAELGVDEALAFLESKQPEIEERVDTLESLRDQAEEELRAALSLWVLKAEMHETKFEWDKAQKLYETVVKKTPEWSRARRQFGYLLVKLARFADAEQQLMAAVKLADDDFERSLAADTLGLLYVEVGRLQDAEALLQQTLELSEQIFGRNDPKTASALNNLGMLYFKANRFSEAEPHLQRALEIESQSNQGDLAELARARSNLAAVLQAMRRLDDAEPMMRQALADCEQCFGENHPRVATALNNLAMLFQQSNRLSEAESCYRRALAIDERIYEAAHPEVARVLNNLGELCRLQNHLAEAELLQRRAVAIAENCYADQHPDVARSLNNLGLLLQATQRSVEAEAMFRRALAIDERDLGPRDRDVARELNSLGELLRVSDRSAESVPLFRRAVAIWEETISESQPEIAAALHNLALVIEPISETAAELLFVRAVTLWQASVGEHHPDFANGLNSLATTLKRTYRQKEAEPMYRHALVVYEKSYGAVHPSVATVLANFGVLLVITDRREEAVPVMRRAVEILNLSGQSMGHEHPFMAGALQIYRRLLDEMGRPSTQLVTAALETAAPLTPIVPEVNRLLGEPKPVAEALTALEAQYREQGRSDIWFLPVDEPITLHLDKLLGPGVIDVPFDQPIAPHLDQLLGPTKSTQEVFDAMDRQYREQGKPPVWFLPLDEPIAPHLDELLGPSKLDVPLDEPISPHLDEYLGPSKEVGPDEQGNHRDQ